MWIIHLYERNWSENLKSLQQFLQDFNILFIKSRSKEQNEVKWMTNFHIMQFHHPFMCNHFWISRIFTKTLSVNTQITNRRAALMMRSLNSWVINDDDCRMKTKCLTWIGDTFTRNTTDGTQVSWWAFPNKPKH